MADADRRVSPDRETLAKALEGRYAQSIAYDIADVLLASGVLGIPAEPVSDSAKASDAVTDNNASQRSAVQRTADRDRLIDALWEANYGIDYDRRDAPEELEAITSQIDSLIASGVFVPADLIRAEALEVEMRDAPDEAVITVGYLRARTAEYRAGA